MMPLRRFTIHQPKTVTEAAETLAHYGETGRLYAGGTELLLAMKHGLLRYEHLVDIKTVPNLTKIEVKDSHLSIGALTTHREIEKSPLVREKVPVLADMETNVANVRVRATGTLGGNLCFAEPHSDPANLLLCLGASVRIHGAQGERKVSMDELIVDAYETSLGPDEVLTSIEIPIPDKSQRASYLKFQFYERPTLGLALLLNLDEGGKNIAKARAVVGCIGLKPCRSDKAEALLIGPKDKAEKQLLEAAQILSDLADPSDDLQGSAEYKRHLVGVFLRRAFAKALSE